MARVFGATLFVLLFNAVAFTVMLVLSPSLGAVWGAGLGTAFLLWLLRYDAGRRKRLALVRLRPPRASRQWQLVAVAASILLLLGLTGLIQYADPPMDPDAPRGWEPLTEYMSQPGAWTATIVLMAVVAPLVEEVCFRGYVQHTLERWWGPVPAIGVASVFFMVAHVGRPHWSILLIPLTLGLVNGAVVWLSRSIWPAVVIHGVWNLGLVASGVVQSDAPAARRLGVAAATGPAGAGHVKTGHPSEMPRPARSDAETRVSRSRGTSPTAIR